MNSRYFKKFWDENSGDELTDSWGNSTYYFETDLHLNVTKQLQLFQNGKMLKYDHQNLEDEFGFLTDQPLFKSLSTTKLIKLNFMNFGINKNEYKLSNDFKSALRHFCVLLYKWNFTICNRRQR